MQRNQGRSDGGYIGIYTLPKPGQVNFLWGKIWRQNGYLTYSTMSIKVFLYLPKKFYTSPKQISGYAPERNWPKGGRTISYLPGIFS